MYNIVYYVKDSRVHRRYPTLLIVQRPAGIKRVFLLLFFTQVRCARLGCMQIYLGKTTLKNELN